MTSYSTNQTDNESSQNKMGSTSSLDFNSGAKPYMDGGEKSNMTDRIQKKEQFFEVQVNLFENKERAFWTLQLLGWTSYIFIRLFNGLARAERIDYWMPTVIAAFTGLVLSLFLRRLLHYLRSKPLPIIITFSVIASTVLAMVFSFIETIGHVQFYDPFWDPVGIEYLANSGLNIYVFLSWTALYFGINYYIMFEKEKEKSLKATTLAHRAQLDMLRYQLNPHFLFNTLNAISTLVLYKDTKNADGMLRRLSSFLRYSLVNQPNQKVSLEKEIYAVGLYLDIEKVRFEDRLCLEWNIEEKAKEALIPSLILQPLIENAIKYAIAPSEEGGKITISANLGENRLVLKVKDDGPGLNNKTEDIAEVSETSAGVGLRNTKERLKQIYGDLHKITIHNVKPSGLEVRISIPSEFRVAPKGDKE